MALSPEEQKELEMLEALEAQEQQTLPGLSPEEEQELQLLEQMEAQEQSLDPSGKPIAPGQTHYIDPETNRAIPLPENMQDTTMAKVDSGLLGAVQGASLGFADEAGGAIKTAVNVVSGESSFSDISDQYRKNRDIIRETFKEAEAQNPNTYMAGDILGGVSTTLIPGLGAAAQSVKGAVGIGAAGGAISGLGRTEEIDIQDQIVDSLLGGAVGGAFGAAGYGIGKAAQSAGKSIGKFFAKEGGKELERALGFSSTLSKKELERVARSKGIPKLEMLKEVIDEVGPDGSKIFSPVKSIDDQFDALKATVDQYGKGISRTVGVADDIIGAPSVDPTDFRANLTSDLDDLLNSDSAAEAEAAGKFLNNLVNPKQMQQPWTLKRLWSFRQKIDDVTNHRTDGAIENKLKKRTRASLEKYLRQQMESIPEAGQEVFEAYIQSSDKYSKLRITQDAFQDNIIAVNEGFIGALRKTVHFGGLGIGALAGGTVAGTPGMLIGGMLGRAAQKGIGGKVLGRALIKAGAVASKNTQYSQKLIQAAGRSGAAFEQALSIGEAMHDFSVQKLPRTSEAVKKDFTKLFPVIADFDENLAKDLQNAVANDDDATISGLMSQIALHPDATKYVEKGIGWDGKAVTEGDIKDVENMIKTSQISAIQKSQLMLQFNTDRNIPQIQEEKPFYKVYDPALKRTVRQ